MLIVKSSNLIYSYGKFRINLIREYPLYFLLIISILLYLLTYIFNDLNNHSNNYVINNIPKTNKINENSSYKILIKSYNPSIDIEELEKLIYFIKFYSNLYSLNINLILSLIAKESSFYKYSVSSTGAIGYGQILIRWHHDKLKKLNIKNNQVNLYDTETNIKLTCIILRDYITKYGSTEKALAHYLGSNNYDENLMYANSIINNQLSLK